MKSKAWLCMSLFMVITLAVSAVGAGAAPAASPPSPFVGHWQATDTDGSDIRLTIAGPPGGPFQITWTEDYLSVCEGGPGIIRGTGVLNPDNPYLLETDLEIECHRGGTSQNLQMTFRYLDRTDTLSAAYPEGLMLIFHHPGHPNLPPAFSLRVNYGDDWVESFYESGHTVWIAVTEADGRTVKATAEVNTSGGFGGPDHFGTEGFEDVWSPEQPDIQPYDWVYGWVDNGASAMVRIGEINAQINMESDSVTGTVTTDWFSDEVNIVCDPWGLDDLEQYRETSVLPNGSDQFTCSWDRVLNIQPDQGLGVWYYGPDGNAIANAFTARGYIVSSTAGDWFWFDSFEPASSVSLSIYESVEPDAMLRWEGTIDDYDGGIAFVGSDQHGIDLAPGNYIVVSDPATLKGLVLEEITMDVFDPATGVIAGTAPPGRWVRVNADPSDEGGDEIYVDVQADLVTGEWQAYFGVDVLTEGMRDYSTAQLFDDDGDINEAGTPPPPPNPTFEVFPEGDWMNADGWPDGAVNVSVDDKPGCSNTQTPEDGHFTADFPEGCDVQVGDLVTMDNGSTTRTHEVRYLTVTMVDRADSVVVGLAAPGSEVHVWVHDYYEETERLVEAGDDGTWTAEFSPFELTQDMCGRVEINDEYGNGTAKDWCVPNARILVEISDDWFEAQEFAPDADLSFEVYASQGGDQLTNGSIHTDDDGNVGIWVGDVVDLLPGNYIVISDGSSVKDIVLEDLHFELFDLAQGNLSGMAPPPAGRMVWVGIGFPDDGWGTVVSTEENGSWFAEYGEPVPSNYEWVAAQVFDEDGDASEVRPMDIQGLWIEAFTGSVDLGSLDQGVHPYYLSIEYSLPFTDSWSGQWGDFTVSDEAETYDGYVLLRGSRGQVHGFFSDGDLVCEDAGPLRPTQPTLFVAGWLVGYGMSEEDAQAHFGSLTMRAGLDESALVELAGQGMRPYRPDDPDSWADYVCSFTEPEP